MKVGRDDEDVTKADVLQLTSESPPPSMGRPRTTDFTYELLDSITMKEAKPTAIATQSEKKKRTAKPAESTSGTVITPRVRAPTIEGTICPDDVD